MNTLSWNCRGLGNPRAQQFLADICCQKKPKFLFLCETLCSKDLVDRVKFKLGFESCFAVEAVGRSGGLAFFWKFDEEARLLGYSKHHVDFEITVPGTTTWRLTGFYGEPDRSLRPRTWALIRTLLADSPLPWCLIGDFNNIANQSEKNGGRPYPNALIEGFQSVLHECSLHDLDLHGHPYTWERGRNSGNLVEIRLDRALVTQLWLDTFHEVTLSNLPISSSDHTPIFLEFHDCSYSSNTYHFRFENSWCREPMCAQIVKAC
ncbi:uncharacterized protein LOC133039154 [Cannabis sativa]|uniref:uncharacterized protein LOC133039154 n=1 Tax=Cannabis sativa TaxID=3483 RepID=UPI0029CAA482|nr:uncharacterized protein LOC133039154 [Cannabis sativa]